MNSETNRHDEFFNCFDLTIANPAQQIASCKLRHQVYCEELKWEQPNPKGMESDDFDRSAHHILLTQKRIGQIVGTVRVIVADRVSELPHPRYFPKSSRTSVRDLHEALQSRCGEISRLAVHQNFRRKTRENYKMLNYRFNSSERMGLPILTMALYMASIALVQSLDIGSVYIVTRPGLNRRISEAGIKFSPVSHCIELHGQRRLHHAFNDENLTDMNGSLKDFYGEIQAAIGLQEGWNLDNKAVS